MLCLWSKLVKVRDNFSAAMTKNRSPFQKTYDLPEDNTPKSKKSMLWIVCHEKFTTNFVPQTIYFEIFTTTSSQRRPYLKATDERDPTSTQPLQSIIPPSSKYHTTLFKVPHNLFKEPHNLFKVPHNPLQSITHLKATDERDPISAKNRCA